MLSEDCGKFVDCEKTTKQKYRKPDKNKVSGFFLFLSGFEPLAFRLGGGRSILLSYRNICITCILLRAVIHTVRNI